MRASSCLCAFVVLVPFLSAPSDDLDERLDQLVSRVVGAERIGGLSIAIDVGGETLFEAGYGYMDAGGREAVAPDSRWRAGALLAPLTSLAVLRLAEAGELDLEAPLSDVFDGLEFDGQEVSLAQVLSQTSGLPSYVEWMQAAREDTPLDPEAVLEWLRERGLDAEPGNCFEWSSTNVLLAGLVLERLGGEGLAAHLESTLFEPLGLEATSFGCDAPLRRAFHASWEFAGGLRCDDHALLPFEADGLCSSAPDLVRLVRALVERELIEESTWRRLTTPVRLRDGSQVPFSLGFGLGDVGGREALTFGGGFGGVRYHVAHYPSFDLTVAVLATGEEAPVDRLERDVARALLDLPSEEQVDLPVPEEGVATYVGDYWYGCTRMQILEREERLWLVDVPTGAALALAFQGRHVFLALDDAEVRLEFLVEGPRASSFALVNHGMRSVLRRVD